MNGKNLICWQGIFKGNHSGLNFCLSGKAVPECSTSVVKTTFSQLGQWPGNEHELNLNCGNELICDVLCLK